MAISLTLFYGSPNAMVQQPRWGSIARASQKLNAIALSQFRVSLTAVLFLTSLAPCATDPAHAIHYAPIENLEHVDVALIDRAEHEIDTAAYVLTDWPILQARQFDREALWAQTQRADRMKPVTSCLASWRTAVQPA